AARGACVFDGQGTQWPGMGRELCAEAVCREVLEECEALVARYGGWSLADELAREGEASRLAETAIAQPALFAVQVALAALWRAWGIEPAAVVGHSVGEVAAAYVAGVLSLEEAVRVVVARGRALEGVHGTGGMGAVEAGVGAVGAVIGETTGVAVAAENSARMTVVGGPMGALEDVVGRLEAAGWRVKGLGVPYAFHTPAMAGPAAALAGALGRVEAGRAAVPLVSTVRGEWVEGPELGTEYWAANVRE